MQTNCMYTLHDMKIAFVGKGGSGKSTISALFARMLGDQRPVYYIDADINQSSHLLFGIHPDTLPPELGNEVYRIKEHVMGKNIAHISEFIKTSPPGAGSRILDASEHDPIYSAFSTASHGVRFMRVGGFRDEELGTHCYHAKTGGLEVLLNYTREPRDTYIICDMTAGADAFASGLFTRFDITYLVMEPTLQSTEVFLQYKSYADKHGVAITPVANKIKNEGDITYIKRRTEQSPIASIPYCTSIAQGDITTGLQQDEVMHALKNIYTHTKTTEPQSWDTFCETARKFHILNAQSWANDIYKKDLTYQAQQP